MNTKLDNIVHSNLGKIITTNNNFRDGIYELKNSENFEGICRTTDKLLEASKTYQKHIFGNPLPDSIESVGKSKNNFAANNIKVEIDWFLLSLRKYKAELNIFLHLKNQFESNFLQGDYVAALENIEECIKIAGYSIWALSAKFLVYEYTSSSEKAKLLLSEVLEKNSKGIFTSSLLNFLNQRSEKKLSAYKYDSDLKNALASLKSNLDLSNKDYYNFQLNFFETRKFTELKDILCFDYSNSVVDRYLTFRRLIFYCVANQIELEFIASRISFMNYRVHDQFLDSIVFFLNGSYVKEGFFDKNYTSILDLFYSGQYEKVLSEIKNEILQSPCDFTLLNLYSRSLVFLNKPFKPISENNCVLNEITEHIYKIYQRKNTPSESLYSLYQISKNIDSFDLNYQLNYFIKKQQNYKVNPFYFYFSLRKADAKLVELFNKKDLVKNEFLDKLKIQLANSISFNYKLNSLTNDFDSLNQISRDITLIDKARFLFSSEKYDDSIVLWEEINHKYEHVQPILEIAIEYIFMIYVKLGELDKAIKWFVFNYSKNPFNIFKIETLEIHRLLKKGRFKNVSVNIFLPIFISIISNDENEKSFSVELFCKKNDANLPSDLIGKSLTDHIEFLELFYSLACSNDILAHYRNINTTKKRLEERITICTYLAKRYPLNQERYIQEINLLTNEMIINEGIHKLDESKIYANEQAILNNELEEYQGLYKRYMTIAGLYLKNIKVLTVNKNELRYLNKKTNTDYSQNEVEYSSQAHLDAFYNLFSVIRYKFLFSKFGIVTYLSTRIRHGVFLGELRPELEINNLIFFKNKLKDAYEPTDYWKNCSKVTVPERNALIKLIISFSEKVDSFINSIIKENIQIKLNDENNQGWLDYDFSYDDLMEPSVTLYYEDDYLHFCKKNLQILWERTDKNLEEIRKILITSVKSKFIDLLNDFEFEAKKIIDKYRLPELFTSLTASSTNIQNKIDKISSWFNRSGKTHSDFRLDNLINIICFNVQRSYPNRNLELQLDYRFDRLIKGEYYEHFSDLIRNFIDNILKHTTSQRILCISAVFVAKGVLEMSFENNVDSNSSIPIDNFGYGSQVDGIKLITENKSGLTKSKKIVKDDLNNENNEIYIKSENGKFKITIVVDPSTLIV